MKKSHDRSLWDIRDFAPVGASRALRPCTPTGRQGAAAGGARQCPFGGRAAGGDKQDYSWPFMPLCVKERGSGERKRRLAPCLFPYRISLTFHILPASSHASANALQAASRSKNVKLPFRKKAGRQLHVIADLLPAADRPPFRTAPPRTRHRHLAGRRGRGTRRTHPPHPAP